MNESKTPTCILQGSPPTSATARTVDFADTILEDSFAIVIDNVLTIEECQSLLSLVEPADGTPWPAAGLSTYDGGEVQDTEFRKCGRIIYRSPELADSLLKRIMPFLPPQVVSLKDSPEITGPNPMLNNEPWKISRLRKDLRFLKYEPGGFFKPHCDSMLTDMKRSFLTVHLYLNDEGLEGGATSFLISTEPHYQDVKVNPKAGSVLVFQQRDMYHEGCEVTKGVKYTVRTDVLYEKV
ncbi:hypothetical protein BJ170DRAFT_681911 [Xylariales sp. AK1849]|nr:hypothetical protein BJ170DRAFT_681911 [Xylariales sp. AK1849]